MRNHPLAKSAPELELEREVTEPPILRRVSVGGGEKRRSLEQMRRHRRQSRRLTQALLDGHHALGFSSEADSEAYEPPDMSDVEDSPPPWYMNSTILSLAVVLCGCCCQAPAEVMLSNDRGCGDLISLAEALYGLVASAPGALSERKNWRVPLRTHAALAGASVGFTLLMNKALASSLPPILLMTLKNGTLVANALVGRLLLGQRYSFSQLAAIALVSIGLVVTAKAGPHASGPTSLPTAPAAAPTTTAADAALAVACACGALLCRALSGALTERACTAGGDKGGTSASELLFFRNLLALPVLALRAPSIARHAHRWHALETLGLVRWPHMWLLLAANLIFDFACKMIITTFIAAHGALRASLALTAQRFCAVILSTTLLEPALRASPRLWIGAACVLGGTVAFNTICTPHAGAGSPSGRSDGRAKRD